MSGFPPLPGGSEVLLRLQQHVSEAVRGAVMKTSKLSTQRDNSTTGLVQSQTPTHAQQ